MVMKKIFCTLRDWLLLLVHVLIPIVFVILTVLAARSSKIEGDLPELELSLDTYDKPVTVISGSGAYKQGYIGILDNEDRSYEDIANKNMSEYILQKRTEEGHKVRQHYILATAFDGESICALFNNEPLHSPPLALAMAVKGVVRSKLDSDHNIRFTNYPFPFTMDTKVSLDFTFFAIY